MFSQDSFTDSKHTAAAAVSIIFGGLLLLLSSITSAAFFAEYAATAFSFISPSLSPYLAAAAGVLVFEGASITWSWLKANDADTSQQLTTATLGAWSSMAGGLLVTVIFFSLSTTLINLDQQAAYFVSMLGVLLIIFGVAGNFCLIFVYRLGASSHQLSHQQAEIRALKAAASFTVLKESTQANMIESVTAIRESIPAAAAAQATAAKTTFLASSPNGQRKES